MKYTVYVDDNFHYMDESERYKLGEFETAEEAISQAKALVEGFLISAFRADLTAADLYDQYTDFGEDPWISPKEDESSFSAWSYAEKRCADLCHNGGSIDKVLALNNTGGGEVAD